MDCLSIQLARTITAIADKNLNKGKERGSFSPVMSNSPERSERRHLNNQSLESFEGTLVQKDLVKFEAAYDNCNKLIEACITKKENERLIEIRKNLVFHLLENGIVPGKSWADNACDFEDVLLEALKINVENGCGYQSLMCLICDKGQSEVIQFLCDYLPSADLKAILSQRQEAYEFPIDAAIRNRHVSVIEILASRFPELFRESLNDKVCSTFYRNMVKLVASGDLSIISILAKVMSPNDFANLITWEGGRDSYNHYGSFLFSSSILSWALENDYTELLQIMKNACPETVKLQRDR